MLIDVTKLSVYKCEKPIIAKLKYATTKNFIGRVINGYVSSVNDIALLTPKAAEQLCQVQNELIYHHGLGLLVYDAYRPKRAVTDFMIWSHQNVNSEYELERKAKHYPHIDKNQLFELGYIAEDSNHCYGNTVDLVLIDGNSGKKLDMGTRFDFMDVNSHVTASELQIGKIAYENRLILSTAMYPVKQLHLAFIEQANFYRYYKVIEPLTRLMFCIAVFDLKRI